MERRQSPIAGLALLLFGFLILLPTGSFGQICSDFPDGGTLSGVVNTYYRGRGTASAGATQIRVYANSIRPGTNPAIAADDMLLVIQMQDADINSFNSNLYGDGVASDPANGQTALNSAGYFEYVVAQSAVSGNGYITITGAGTGNGLIHTYRTASSTSDTPRRLFQVVRVPRYRNATLSSSLTASEWNGVNGGILALDITGTLTLGGTVSVDGLGFRGGAGRQLGGDSGGANTDYRTSATSYEYNGAKGEGIVGTPRYVFNGTLNVDTGVEGYPNGSQARGAPGNAGGGGTDGNQSANDENSGGGGGSNGGLGGYGGRTWDSDLPRGGHPGAVFPYAVGTNARIAMGGGGGAGTRNNSPDITYASAGGLGGGIVIIRATTVTGTGTITANGRGRDISGITPDNDGGGGGGAGGTVVIVTRNGSLAGLTLQARGGGGVDSWPDEPPGGYPGERHGPGGGGGGGVILLSDIVGSVDLSGGVNGTATNVQDPYGATSGSSGVSQTATMNQIPGVQSCDNDTPTRATIRGLRVDPRGFIEFATGSQQGSAAFYVWQTSDPSGKEGRERLTNDPVISLPDITIDPVIYRVQTHPITAPFLMIEEIESGGARRMIGPFPVLDERLAEEFARVEKRLTDAEAGRSSPKPIFQSNPAPSRKNMFLGGSPSDSGAIKIEVSDAGTVQAPIAELISMGLPEALPGQPGSLQLTYLGESIPFQVIPGQGDPGVIQFMSSAISTDYTNRNVYVLSWQRSIPKPSVEFTRSGFSTLSGMERIERNIFYAGFVAKNADPWIWGFINTSATPEPFSFDVLNLGPQGVDPVAVRIGFSGGTDHMHTVKAKLNGQAVGEVSFEGKTVSEISGQVPPGTVQKTGNQLTIEYTANVQNPTDIGLIFLDIVDLGVAVEQPSAQVPFDRLSPYDSTLPDLKRVNYLIITHELFLEGAERIAAQKRQEGYKTAVIDVERAYDLYSGGLVEAKSVQQLIRDARKAAGNTFKYVLLIGDDTFDPKNYMGLGLVSFLPSLNGRDEFFGRVPSENLYADTNGDGAPELAIGRLPVATAEQMGVLADKIIQQDSLLAAGKGSQLFVVDNQGDEDPPFKEWAETVAETLPQGVAVKWADVSLGASTARSILLDGLKTGNEATHYFGHGGFEIWTDDGLLTVSDADGLAGSGVGTVLFSWTCEVQWFQYHLGPTINEALLLVPNGGAVAALGPAGITDAEPQRIFFSKVYSNLKNEMTLGEAIRRAKASAIKIGDSMRPVVEGWNLLGDPALRLKWGSSK